MEHRRVFRGCYASSLIKVNGTTLTFGVAGAGKNPIPVDIDMTRCSGAVKHVVEWNDVVVDAGMRLPQSSLSMFYGPIHDGSFAGALYLEATFADKADIPPMPPGFKECMPYQFEVVVDWQPQAASTHRFLGFHARIFDVLVVKGKKLALVGIYNAVHDGAALADRAPASPLEWLDLDDAEFDKAKTTIKVNGPLEGAIFIEQSRARNRELRLPAIAHQGGIHLGKKPDSHAIKEPPTIP